MIKYLPDELSARYIKPWLTITKVLVAVGLATMFWSPYRAALAQQEDVIEAGRRQFTEKCAVCHGLSGKGDGALAAKLKGQPADLTRSMEELFLIQRSTPRSTAGRRRKRSSGPT
jgi:cytochrome c553